MNNPHGLYWIRPLLTSLAIGATPIVGGIVIAAKATRRNVRDLLDDLLELLAK